MDVQQRFLTISILQHNQEIKNIDKRVTAWMVHFEPLIERWLVILANMRSATNLSFIMFYVAVRELYDLTALISQSS